MAKISEKKKKNIIKTYATLNKTLQRRPTMYELVGKGFTKDSIKHYVDSISKLDRLARTEYPECFFDVEIKSILTKQAICSLRANVKKYKRFVVTTAVTGCAVDEDFYDSIKKYCAVNDAHLLILVASDPAHNKETAGGYGSVDAALAQELIVLEDTQLNSNLFLSTIKLSAKHIDPISGLDRIGHRNGSFIFASPKQRLQMVATSNTQLPFALMTTGSITKANYSTDLYMSERTAYIADCDHVVGAIIIEVEDKSAFHFRQIQASKDGSFADLGKRYSKDKVVTDNPHAVILGDLHAGETDPVVMECTKPMLELLKPKYIVLHDAFNGMSINHHEENNQISRAIKANNGNLSLEKEVCDLASHLSTFAALASKSIIIVKSNHDEFLSKHYLQYGKYIQDPHNHAYSLPLAIAMLNGQDPLKFAVEAKLRPIIANKIQWLSRDEDFIVGDVALGAHGDRGPNGSKGTLRGMEKAYGNSVTGHSHSPGILRGAWAVGTSSRLQLGYNVGPSSWLHTHCLVYEDGSRQLINIINGKWRLEK